MSGMPRTETLRDETLDGLSQCLCCRTAEHLFGGGIEQYDTLLFIHGNDRIGCGLKDAGQPGFAFPHRFFGPLAFGNVGADGYILAGFAIRAEGWDDGS